MPSRDQLGAGRKDDMRCSNCGKDVPFNGNVCPWCNNDKTADKQTQILGFFFGLVGGALGWLIHGFGVALIGIVIGVLVGMYVASR
jgi:hypothetical protein